MSKRTLVGLILSGAAFAAGQVFFARTGGVVTLTCLAARCVGAVLLLKYVLELAALFGKELPLRPLSILALVLAALFVPVLAFEGFLTYQAQRVVGRAAEPSIALPVEWARRPAQVAGATAAFYWHGHLHVFNADAMRRVGPFPARKPNTFRVMVLGDSLTYGYGIAEDDTYCRVLERELNQKYRIEVLNLGRCGDQSADILATLRTQFPLLQPDLVVYGVCLNDFLPSGIGQYQNNMAWQVRFPGQKHLLSRTQIGPFLARKYDDLLGALRRPGRFLPGHPARIRRLPAPLRRRRESDERLRLIAEPAASRGDGPRPVAGTARRRRRHRGGREVPAQRRHGGHPHRTTATRRATTTGASARGEGHPNEVANRVFAREFRPYIEKAMK